jgi:hypothetical protein
MAKRGRPIKDDDFFAMEVHRVMAASHCGVREACRRIANGWKIPLPPRKGIKRFTKGSPWQNSNAGTLEQRYFRWLRREEKRQQALALKIEFP